MKEFPKEIRKIDGRVGARLRVVDVQKAFRVLIDELVLEGDLEHADKVFLRLQEASRRLREWIRKSEH